MCPKCGEKFEVNLKEVDESVVCRYCLSNCDIPYQARCQMEEDDGSENYAMSGSHDESGLDSSFWLS
jgi:hypothetical protein